MSTATRHGAGDDAAAVACTCALLRRTARRLTQAYDQALRPTGLRVTQYSLLASLARGGGLSITELAALMVMDRTTLTRNLRPLERAGWVRIGAGGDQRSRAVDLTPGGRRVFERALPLWQEAERSFRRRMGRDEVKALCRLLEQARASAPPIQAQG
jgi:DNA-binding MarR family transcriptional regulator